MPLVRAVDDAGDHVLKVGDVVGGVGGVSPLAGSQGVVVGEGWQGAEEWKRFFLRSFLGQRVNLPRCLSVSAQWFPWLVMSDDSGHSS